MIAQGLADLEDQERRLELAIANVKSATLFEKTAAAELALDELLKLVHRQNDLIATLARGRG